MLSLNFITDFKLLLFGIYHFILLFIFFEESTKGKRKMKGNPYWGAHRFFWTYVGRIIAVYFTWSQMVRGKHMSDDVLMDYK